MHFKKTLLAFASVLMMSSVNAAEVNYQDAHSVATAFWQALAEKDFATAKTLVIKEDREAFVEEISEALAEQGPLPEHPEVTIDVVEGAIGSSELTNWTVNAGVDMKFEDNRWWIKK
jgi:hypothetical protein